MSFTVMRKNTKSTPTVPPIDLRRIQLTSGGDRAFEHELLDLFVTDTQHRIADLEQLIVSSDWAAVRGTAHTIKGASASIGAPLLREAAYLLEREASLEDLSHAAERLAALRDELAAVAAFVANYKTL